MYRRINTDSPSSIKNVRSRSTQSNSPEENRTKIEDARKFVLSPLTESTIRDDISRIELYNKQHFVKSKAKDILHQKIFDDTYGFRRINVSLFQRVVFYYRQAAKWHKKEWIQFVSSRIPITSWIVSYNWKSDFLLDLIGGLMISIMSVPQSLAYGMLVGVPPNYGLLTGIIGPLIYAIFGTSRHSSPGAFAIVSLMVGATVDSYGNLNSPNITSVLPQEHSTLCCKQIKPPVSETDAIGIATSVTLLVGLFQILFGLMNAGLLSVWLSDHLVQGLTSGAAIHVMTSQLKSMTGISTVPPTSEPFQLVQFYFCFFNQIKKAHIVSVVCSLICIVLLLISAYVIDPRLCKLIPVKFPMELILVVTSTLAVYLSQDTNWEIDMPIVGKVENGIPAPKVPSVSTMVQMFDSAISIAIISFVIHIALCKLVSKKMNYVIDSNQEWLALGLMHTTSAFFGCFAGGSSLGRTMMQVKCGTKSQLSTIICSFVLIIFVMGAAKFIYYLPKAVLASIVVVAMKDLFIQLYTAISIRKKSFFDFLIFAITFSAVIILNVNFGLIVGVAFALLTVVFRTQWADSTLLGRIKGTNHFRGLSHYGAAHEIPGIKVFRFDSPLYFANSELFLNRIHSTCGLNPIIVRGKLAEEEKKNREAQKRMDAEMLLPNKDETQLEVKGHHVKALGDKSSEKSLGRKDEFDITQLTHIIIDCSSIPYVDLMGKDALIQTYIDYKSIDIEVLFANTKEVVRQLFDATDFFDKVPANRMFVSISDAVNQAKLEQQSKYEANDHSGKARSKPAPNQPVAKSVAQKTAPLVDYNLLTATQSSVTLMTGIDNSVKDDKRRPRATSRLKTRERDWMDDVDKTQ